MSTIKSNNVQIGQSLTASQNFTLYQPAIPDGTFFIANGNSASPTNLITVGSTGNLTFTGTTETYTNSVTISAASTKTLTLNGGAGSNGLVIDANNNVGIGYNTPGAYRVYVKSTDTAVWAANTSQSQIISYNAGVANNACSTMEYQVVYGDSTAGGVKIGAVASASYSGDFVIANRNNGTYQENLRLTYSGNLGLGVTPSAWVSNRKVLQVGGLASAALALNGTSAVGEMFFNCYQNTSGTYNYSQSSYAAIVDFNSSTAGGFTWRLAGSGTGGGSCVPSSAMTLDASGNLLVGKTSSSDTTVGLNVYSSGAVTSTLASASSANTSYATYSTGAGAYRFYVDMAGTIHATSTSITAISDISLKENIRPLETGLSEILALKPRRFDWKNGDGSGVAGFIAQEVIDVLPDLVRDYKYNDTETKKALKMGDMIPTLVKAIQELSAELNELKQKVNA